MDPAWLADPTGRAAWRWWDGTEWSRFSADYEPTEPPDEYKVFDRTVDLRMKDSDRPHPLLQTSQMQPAPPPPVDRPTDAGGVKSFASASPGRRR